MKSNRDDGRQQASEDEIDAREMPAALGYVSHANRTSDTINTGERVRDLRQRIKQLNADCDQLQLRVASKERDRNSIEDHGRGWPLIAVFLLGIVAIGLEYFPATQFTQIFDTSDAQRVTFTAIFTVVPAVLALSLGELLRRCRVPVPQHMRDTILLASLGILTAAFLAIGFLLRLAYTSASGTGAIGLTPWMEALALTSIATIGIALTVVSAYYREGLPMYRVSRSLKQLQAQLAELEAHLKADQRDLERAEAAYRGEPIPAYSKWSPKKPTPAPGGISPDGPPSDESLGIMSKNGMANDAVRDDATAEVATAADAVPEVAKDAKVDDALLESTIAVNATAQDGASESKRVMPIIKGETVNVNVDAASPEMRQAGLGVPKSPAEAATVQDTTLSSGSNDGGKP